MSTATKSLKKIESIDYFDLIGIVRETNRPPGGLTSIVELAKSAGLSQSSKVLEIGTSTGFTAIELAKLVGCKITAIDVNQDSLNEARRRAKEEGVDQCINFENQDAVNLKYANETFDLVFCGNVTSYLNNKSKALKEFIRVLKPNGFIAAIPMYYLKRPTSKIVNKVSSAINHKIVIQYKNDWLEFFTVKQLSVFHCVDFKFNYISTDMVNEFVEKIFQQKHLVKISDAQFYPLKNRYRFFLLLFRDNLSLMGFSTILLKKDLAVKDPILFTANKVS